MVTIGVDDTDGDGLADAWELQFFGDLTTTDGTTDSDSDGDTDLQEHIAGTDPTDPASRVPQIVAVTPADGSAVPLPAEGQPLRLTALAIGLLSGDEFRIYDRFGNDVTAHAAITGGGLELIIDPEDLLPPQDNGASEHLSGLSHEYRLVIRRGTVELDSETIEFTVDATPPTVTPSVDSGRFTDPFAVTLIASESATIYYSDDGSYPATIYLSGSNLTISDTTLLRFFARDEAGNDGPPQHALYEFIDRLGSVAGFAAGPDIGGGVACSWAASPNAVGYHLYRATNPFDRQLLEQSVASSIPPPTHLRVNVDPVTDVTFVDSAAPVGVVLVYVATAVDAEGVEGVPCQSVSISLPPESVVNAADAITAALAYLDSAQAVDGGWGEGSVAKRMIATAQVLRAIDARPQWKAEHALSVERGLRFLAGRFADDNDALARSIDALRLHGLSSRTLEIRFAFRGHKNGANIDGWGVHYRYYPDALCTALGMLASDGWAGDLPAVDTADLLGPSATKLQAVDLTTGVANGHYGWTPWNRDSIYVSSLVYHALGQTGPSDSQYAWVLNEQLGDGSFRGNVLDTAAALLWLPLDATARSLTEGYLVNQQEADGTWAGDAFLTALCLEALSQP